MRAIQIELPDELIRELAPYQDRLLQLLALGLETWKEQAQRDPVGNAEQIRAALRRSASVTLPTETGKVAPRRRTPVSISGEAVSVLVIQNRN